MFGNQKVCTTLKWLAIFFFTLIAFVILADEEQYVSIAYILLVLAATLFFYPRIKSIKIFDLELSLHEAKKEIEQKASQVDLRMLVRSIILDSNEKDKVIPFITSPSNIEQSWVFPNCGGSFNHPQSTLTRTL